MTTIEDLLHSASTASSPQPVEESKIQFGGVDPLGLRQINFDLMDQVLPGLNNAAERLRPFVLMAWAWRRVCVIIERDGLGGATDVQMRDFVDRIEAIYAWSQFLTDPNAKLPGRQALAQLIQGEDETYSFGGEAWKKRRDLRRSSTGFVSPLNYGPGLRSMGWLIPTESPGVFQPAPKLDVMLDTFEQGFRSELTHPAFNELGSVDVCRSEVRRWSALWRLSDLTDAEKHHGFDMLAGSDANDLRREGLAMLEAAVRECNGIDVATLRHKMASPPEDWLDADELRPRADAWRRLQIRQLFRLSLEAMFYWILRALIDRPVSSVELADRFLQEASLSGEQSAADWRSKKQPGNPVQVLQALNDTLSAQDWRASPTKIVDGLHFCLTAGGQEAWDEMEPFDRLPLKRALREMDQWCSLPMKQQIVKVMEGWIIAQHTYWCIGRGLADARGRGKTLLRLRIVMDEGGWTLTPGAQLAGVPVPTSDRLQTAISLLRDCGKV